MTCKTASHGLKRGFSQRSGLLLPPNFAREALSQIAAVALRGEREVLCKRSTGEDGGVCECLLNCRGLPTDSTESWEDGYWYPIRGVTNGAAFFAQDSELVGRDFPVNRLSRPISRGCLVCQCPAPFAGLRLGSARQGVIFP